jgi:hypothetical protein
MRAFEYDGFISHNAFDGARVLTVELERFGARVFCDEVNVLDDERVRDRLGSVLMKSRCVVLHVPLGFRDSGWCRAEYRLRLPQGIKEGFTRVVLARGAPEVPVPDSLASVSTFDVPRETSRLAEFLVALNRVPENIATEFTAQEMGAYGASLGSNRTVRDRGMHMLEAVSMLRNYVERKDRSLTVDFLDTIAAGARMRINVVDIDTRTNAHRALVLVAALSGDQPLVEEINGYLRREPSDAVLVEVLRLYFWAGLPAGQDDTWVSAALLRATAGVRTVATPHEFLGTLPDSVRCRVVQGTIGLGPLSIVERALLLKRRLGKLMKSDAPLELEPYEIEGSLREFLPFLDTEDEETGIRISDLYRELVSAVLAWAERRKGEPIQKMGEYACDVLIEPLARLMTEEATSLEVFERACHLVEEQTSARDLVNRLRAIGHLVRGGASWCDARAQIERGQGPF